MTNIAYLFPGQGSQYVGMGREFYDNFPAAQNIFDQANEILKVDIKKLCFEGPAESLEQTINAQVAIYVVSMAAFEVFKQHPKSKNFQPRYTAGLSLGEYSALAASDVFSFENGLRLVRKRAEFIQEAAQNNPGKMAAILGMELDKLREICQKTGAEIANLNCPGQIVITGKTESVDSAKELTVKEGATKAIDLQVSGAFHSSLMQEAGKRLAQELESTKVSAAQIPVISNFTAKPQIQPQEIKENLIKHISSSVLWEKSIKFISTQGINTFLEIGPGKVLKGLLSRIDRTFKVYNIEKPIDFDSLP